MFHGLSGNEFLHRIRQFLGTDIHHWLRAKNKKPLQQQLRECLDLYGLYRALPVQYVKHDLFTVDHLGDYRDYVPNTLAEAFEKKINPKCALPNVDDKAAFENLMRRHGLPVISTLFHLRTESELLIERCTGAAVSFSQMLDELEENEYRQIFLKPQHSSQGSGVARFSLENGQLISNGSEYNAQRFAELLVDDNPYSEYLLQPLIQQHPQLNQFNSNTLNTVRVVTFREGSRIHLIGATLRMGVGNMITDNRSGGGLAVGIDCASGELHEYGFGSVTDYGTNRRMCCHPDTQIRFAGQGLPYWQEILELARLAARATAPIVVVGWDIAITPAGPILVEANSNPDNLLLQLAGGIRKTILGYQLAAHYGWKEVA